MNEEIDKQNMIGVVRDSYQQVADALRAAGDISVSKDVNKIVFFGMGGSGNPGKAMKDYLDLPIPVLTVHTYDVPSYVDENTLAFFVTFSGGTEETLAAFMQAKELTKHIVTLGSGGRIRELAEKYGFAHAQVSKLSMPRLGLYSMILTALRVLENSGIVEDQSAVYEEVENMLKDCDARNELGKEIASNLKDKHLTICAEDRFAVVGYIWRISFNENSKVYASNFDFPEITHNSVSMWVREHPDFAVLFVLDKGYHSRVITSMRDTAEWIQDKVGYVKIVETEGESKMTRMCSQFHLASFVSYYLSLEYGDDPTPVDMQDEAHKRLRDLDGDIREGFN